MFEIHKRDVLYMMFAKHLPNLQRGKYDCRKKNIRQFAPRSRGKHHLSKSLYKFVSFPWILFDFFFFPQISKENHGEVIP